jgi:hypothetical protein
MQDKSTETSSLKDRFTRHGADTALEFVLLVGFIAIVAGLMFKVVPTENKEQFAQGQGALIVIVTLIAKSLWERRGNEGAAAEASAIRAETTRDAVAKLPPPGTAEQVDRGVAEEAAQVDDDLPEYAR